MSEVTTIAFKGARPPIRQLPVIFDGDHVALPRAVEAAIVGDDSAMLVT